MKAPGAGRRDHADARTTSTSTASGGARGDGCRPGAWLAPRCLKKKPRFATTAQSEREQDAKLNRHERVSPGRHRGGTQERALHLASAPRCADFDPGSLQVPA